MNRLLKASSFVVLLIALQVSGDSVGVGTDTGVCPSNELFNGTTCVCKCGGEVSTGNCPPESECEITDPPPDNPSTDPKPDPEPDADEPEEQGGLFWGRLNASLDISKDDHCFLFSARPMEGFLVTLELRDRSEKADYDICAWKWQPEETEDRKYDECANHDGSDTELVTRSFRGARSNDVIDLDAGDYLVCIDKFSTHSAGWEIHFSETAKFN